MTLADQIADLGYPVGMGVAPDPDAVAAMRNAIIEECAMVVQNWDNSSAYIDIIKAIRALKDKPHGR